MRLSEWRARAPIKDAVSPKVMVVVEAALSTLGAAADPECWVVWGDDPSIRYQLLAPVPSGLIQANVRVSVPGEGPRASGKVVRWNRIQLGELGVEIQGGHRFVTFQVEGQVLTGADAVADAIAVFGHALFAAVDGRAGSFADASRKTTAKPAARKAGTTESARRPVRPLAAKGS